MPAVIVPPFEEDELYRRDILARIQNKIDEHPRSAQIELGPSEIGGCTRKVAYKQAYGAQGDQEGGWAAHKGTLLHAWLDDVFSTDAGRMPDGSQRFYSDLKLPKSHELVNGGTLDLYDRLVETVVDWKCPGDWTMKNVRNGGISEGYYVQTMVYAYGLEQRMNLPVSRVGIAFLPMCGDDLHSRAKGAIFRFWRYDRQVAIDAFAKVELVKRMREQYGDAAAIEMMPIKSDFCSSCPAFSGSGDRRATCPGVSGQRRPGSRSANPFA